MLYNCPECSFQTATLAMLGKHMLDKHNVRGSDFLKLVADGTIGTGKPKVDMNRRLGD